MEENHSKGVFSKLKHFLSSHGDTHGSNQYDSKTNSFKSFYSQSSSMKRVYIDENGVKHVEQTVSETDPEDPRKIKVITKKTIYKPNSDEIEECQTNETIENKDVNGVDLSSLRNTLFKEHQQKSNVNDQVIESDTFKNESDIISRYFNNMMSKFLNQIQQPMKLNQTKDSLKGFEKYRMYSELRDEKLITEMLAERLQQYSKTFVKRYVEQWVNQNKYDENLRTKLLTLKNRTSHSKFSREKWWYEYNDPKELDIDRFLKEIYRAYKDQFVDLSKYIVEEPSPRRKKNEKE